MSRFWVGATLVLFLASAAGAQEDADLVTDRPDQTESPIVIPAGTLQVEVGGQFVSAGDDGCDGRDGCDRIDLLSGPGTLLRYGLSKRFELRFAWPGWIESEARSAGRTLTASGTGDPEIGVKASLLARERGDGFDLALLGHASVPVGSNAFSSPRVDPSLRISGAHELGTRAGLGWNVGCEWASFEAGGDTHTLSRYLYTASVGFDLAPRWGVFVEIFGDFPASDPERELHSFDAGVTWLVRPRVQIDLAAGVGLNAAADDYFIGAGLSFRTPR
jgi:hypothetical protein